MIDTSFFPKPDDELKIITPWWELVIKYLIAGTMIIAFATVTIQVTKDVSVCLPVVICSGAKPATNSSFKTSGNICDKVDKNKLKVNATKKILMSFEKDFRLHAFLDSACFRSAGYSAFYPWILLTGAALLIVANNIWVINPTVSSTLKDFVGLVKECYDVVGTDKQIRRALGKEIIDEDTKKQVDGTHKKSYKRHRKKVGEEKQSKPNNDPEEVPLDPSSGEANGIIDDLPADEKLKIKSLYDKVQKFRLSHFLSISYMFQVSLQILFSAAYISCTVQFFFDFPLSFICTLSDLEEDFAMHYDYIICYRYIVSFYRVVTIYAAIPIFGLVSLSSFFLFVFIMCMFCMPNKGVILKLNLLQSKTVDKNIDIQGDLALLSILLNKQNEVQSKRLLLFISRNPNDK